MTHFEFVRLDNNIRPLGNNRYAYISTHRKILRNFAVFNINNINVKVARTRPKV